MRDLDIGEVAKRAGIPASTLRFYEEKGLVGSVGRRGLRRQYDPDVLERLALIALGRSAGFSLDQIARMFAPDGKLDPISIVCKVISADGRPTVKLSDNPTKALGTSADIERYKRVFHVGEQVSQPVLV